MIHISNALPGSLLLGASHWGMVSVQALTLAQAQDLIQGQFLSAVGHEDTAALFSNLLGVEVLFNRVSLPADLLTSGHNVLLCGLYSGPRLPEGSKVLPEGAAIQWALVSAPIEGATDGLVCLPRPLPGTSAGCYGATLPSGRSAVRGDGLGIDF